MTTTTYEQINGKYYIIENFVKKEVSKEEFLKRSAEAKEHSKTFKKGMKETRKTQSLKRAMSKEERKKAAFAEMEEEIGQQKKGGSIKASKYSKGGGVRKSKYSL